VLPGISTEQLRSRLNRMVADGMLTRKRYREVPPRVDYELTERSRDLMPILGELARWGYEWAWSAPRTGESVDVGAIFRLAPGLIRTPDGSAGCVELAVSRDHAEAEADDEAQPMIYSLTVANGRVSIEESSTERADAQVRGDTSAWVSAFSPDGDRAGLMITGDQTLAQMLLDGLAANAISDRGSAIAPAASAAA
jgi:hypothetical protein